MFLLSLPHMNVHYIPWEWASSSEECILAYAYKKFEMEDQQEKQWLFCKIVTRMLIELVLNV